MWKGRRLWNVRAGRGQVPCRPGLAGVGMGMGIRTGEVAAGRLMWWLPCPHLTPPHPCSPRSTPPLPSSLPLTSTHLAPPCPSSPSPCPLFASLSPLSLSPSLFSLPLCLDPLAPSSLPIFPSPLCLPSLSLSSLSPLSIPPSPS